MAVKRICCILTIILSILSAQKETRFVYELFSSKTKEVKADAGKDIQVPSKTTILLDGSRSTPKKGLQRYEWSFEEGIIFQDDYNFNETDSVILYEFNQDTVGGTDDRVSIKKVTTKNKYIEVALPEMPAGTKIPVILKVIDLKGNHDSDIVWVRIKGINEYDKDYTHTDVVLEDVGVTDTIAEPLIDSTGNQQQKLWRGTDQMHCRCSSDYQNQYTNE